MAKIEVKTSKTFEDGKHTGVITKNEVKDVTVKNGNTQYIDYFINVDDSDVEMKHGLPVNIVYDNEGTPISNHAKFLKSLGVKPGKDFDPDSLNGMKVSFMTVGKETGNGVFQRIVPESVKKL